MLYRNRSFQTYSLTAPELDTPATEIDFQNGFAAALDLIKERLVLATLRTVTAKRALANCNHPDDCLPFAGQFKAAAARQNAIEDLLYSLTEK